MQQVRKERTSHAPGDPTTEQPRRHARVRSRTDVVVALVAILVLAGTWLSALGGVKEWEHDLFWALNDGPGWLDPAVRVTMYAGMLAAVPVAAVVALMFYRYRLALALFASGLLAYASARIIKDVIARGRPLDIFGPGGVIIHGQVQTGLGYPSGHAAVSAALVTAAFPYLPSRMRWCLLAVPLIVGYDRVYVGAHLPLDVVGGWALGVLVASIVHLIVGRPRARRRPEPQASS
jgi:membrane-associated phospholipid phosphatase